MKKLLLAILAFPVIGFSQATDLFISEYGEGNGGNKKYFEIYNGTAAPVDLANYKMWKSVNGGGWITGSVLSFTAGTILQVGETWVVAHNTTDVPYSNQIESSWIAFNGDDALGLAKDVAGVMTLIDVLGTPSADPGSGWAVAGVNNATVDKVIVRKPTVCSPNTDWAASAGTTTENSEWTIAVNNYNGADLILPTAGNHTATCSSSINCGINNAGLDALTCNDNGTGNDADDDYLTFSLNPTGTNLGSNGYTVSVSAGTITPSLGLYGEATSFQLQNGSATAADIVITITDADSTSCEFQYTLTSTGACSSASPLINTSVTTLNIFNHLVGTPSASQNFSVNGMALTNEITVNAPTGFELSLDNTAFTPSLTLTQTSGVVTATDIYVRGNATVYGGYAGNIIISSTGADNDTVAVTGFANDYIAYTIDQINGITETGVADSLNVLVELSGVVQCMDYRAAGYSMVIIDGSNKGINVYRGGNLTNYTEPVGGDSITVKGKIVQFRGLLQVEATEITLHGSNYEQVTPIATTVLDETTENYPVVLQNITLVPNQTDLADGLWPASGSYNPTFTDGTNEFKVRAIGTPLAGTALPNGPVSITGIASQFASSTSAPFLDGYQLLICNENAIAIVCEGANLPNATINVFNDTTLVTTNIQGATYIWTNCDTEEVVTGATAYNFTPTVAGNYKVTIINGECEATSTCSASKVSIENAELGKAIAMFPNPVVDQLTINNYSDVAVTFTVTDMNGKIVTENTTLNSVQTINTTSWNKGVYFVNFIGANNATHTMKVVK